MYALHSTGTEAVMHDKDKIVALPIRTGARPRLLALVLAAAALGACATAPKAPPAPPPAPVAAAPVVNNHAADFRTAYDHYTQGRMAAAVTVFDQVLADANAEPGAKRAAHLGRAMVYLSNDKQLRNLKSARTELTAAAELAAGDESGMGAVDAFWASAAEQALSAETSVADLKGKAAGASSKDKAAWAEERAALLAEQEKLKAALEKLKKVTLEK
jgi:type IV secretory pathway VirB10-like protein